MSFPITPSSSPMRPSRSTSHRAQGSAPPQPTNPPPTFCRLDEYMVSVVPGWKPMSEAEVREAARTAYPQTDKTVEEKVAEFNKQAEEAIRGPGIVTMGMKPQAGDRNVYTVRIPHSPLVIRMWDGGMNLYRQFLLDFYDTIRHAPVNLPAGFSMGGSTMNVPGPFSMAGPLVSWETAFGMKPSEIPAGEEKWSVPEGTYITLRRQGHPDFTFAVPVRQTAQMAFIAQPVLGGVW